jgi:phosphohistidine phosphatase
MKTLYLVRHAKSSWEEVDLADFDRPLNKRGKKNAPFMGEILKESGFSPDLILSSPAQRAKVTAEILAEKLDYPLKKIVFEEEIYKASPAKLLQIIRNQENNIEKLMLVGHNPALTLLANQLTQTVHIENIPTTGIFAVRWQGSTWEDIQSNKAQFLFFDYPKKHTE